MPDEEDIFRRRHPVDDGRHFLTRVEIDGQLDRFKADLERMMRSIISESRFLSEGQIEDLIDQRVGQILRNIHLPVSGDAYKRPGEGETLASKWIDHLKKSFNAEEAGKGKFGRFVGVAAATAAVIATIAGGLGWMVSLVLRHWH